MITAFILGQQLSKYRFNQLSKFIVQKYFFLLLLSRFFNVIKHARPMNYFDKFNDLSTIIDI